jgi:hypothetical protein
MTIWGYFDDENDEVLEYISDLEKTILPANYYSYPITKIVVDKDDCNEEIKELQKEIGYDKTILCYPEPEGDAFIIEYETEESKISLREKKFFMQSNLKDVAKLIEKDYNKGLIPDNFVSGVGMYASRGWESPPYVRRKLDKMDRGFPAPKKLPSYFPAKLKHLSYKTSKIQLDDFNENSDERKNWDRPDLRKDALKHQVRLFS